nr:putative antennal esterase CXE18 [Ectropis grisescens]
MKYIKNVVLFTLFAMNLVDQPAPEVVIEQGILSGKVSADGSFFQYFGIPYATTNSSTRFKAPLPPPSWKGVFRAVDEIYSCPQKGFLGNIKGEEDCLKINVYVPSMAERPLPVMVYIHGGAFYLGSGGTLLYAGDFLVQHEVILVTFNYRLGVLGFTCLNIKEAPGNAGLKDQIAALRWVKKNIAAFGGDPDNITLFGQSAGGASTSLLLASPLTEGLFNKAIVQSGSAIANWATDRDPISTARLIAKTLGYSVTDPKDIYDIFSKTPYKELVAAYPKKPIGKYLDTELLYLPCIEKSFAGEEAVISELPFNLINKKPKDIPLMFGATSREGLFLTAMDTEETIKERDKKYLFASDLKFPSEEEAERIDNMTREVYFGKERMSMKTIANISDLMTDLYFGLPGVFESEIMVKKIKSPVYNYYFDYSGGRNFLKYLTGNKNESGACHADELLYLFRGDMWPFPIDKRDRKMIYYMTKMWTDFAKYSNPTPDSSDVPVKWTPTTQKKLNFLYIDEELKMGPIPNPERYQLWKDIYDKYRKTDYS